MFYTACLLYGAMHRELYEKRQLICSFVEDMSIDMKKDIVHFLVAILAYVHDTL